jgi:hypothetical protein
MTSTKRFRSETGMISIPGIFLAVIITVYDFCEIPVNKIMLQNIPKKAIHSSYFLYENSVTGSGF